MQGILNRLKRSKFRSSFSLDSSDMAYIDSRGLENIEAHAREFVIKRLAPQNPPNDGRQTPFKGHPVFKAQHAVAVCCRDCLKRWHKIASGRRLTGKEVDFVVRLIMAWIVKTRDSSAEK